MKSVLTSNARLRVVAGLCLLAACLCGRRTSAIEVENVTRSLVLFSDDFESGTPGFAPSAPDPEPGTWLFNSDPVVLIADAQSDQIPPNQGSRFLKIARGQRPRLEALGASDAVAKSAAGDLMRIECAVRVQSGVASLYPTTTNHDIGQISFFSDGRVSVVDKAGQNHQFLQQSLRPREWNRVRLEFTNGLSGWSVSLNDASPEYRTSGSSDDGHSGGLLAGFRLQTDSAGTLAYLDRASPPAPPPPPLRCTLTQQGSVSIEWDAPAFRLESAYVLDEPDAWFPLVSAGITNRLFVAPVETAQYFRLSNATLPTAPALDVGTNIQLLLDERVMVSRSNVWLHTMPVDKVGAPLISPDEPWEGTAIQISGVLLDPADGRYKLWYTTHADAGSGKTPGPRTCYAESADGIQWNKPRLGLADFGGNRNNSLVVDVSTGTTSPALDYILLDPRPEEAARRFKALSVAGTGYNLWLSADGLRWSPYAQNPVCDATGDVCPTVFDERQGRFLAFMKTSATVSGRPRRVVGLRTSPDMTQWTPNLPALVPDAAEDERARVMMATRKGWMEYYGMVGFPYGGIYIGLLWPFFCNPEPAVTTEGVIHVELVWSPNGADWRHASDRSPVVPRGTPGGFDGGMTFTAARPLILDDEIRIYYNGWEASHASRWYGELPTDEPLKRGHISLGRLPRDRWVAAESAYEVGRLTTAPLILNGGSLHLNADTTAGRVRVQLLDLYHRPLPGFGLADCDEFQGEDARAHRISWQGSGDLAALAGRPIRLRIQLENARLFAFWFGTPRRAG